MEKEGLVRKGVVMNQVGGLVEVEEDAVEEEGKRAE